MPSVDGAREAIRVVIISANRDTLDDLEGYLSGVGVQTSCSRDLAVLDELAPSVHVVVLFPDDFLARRVVSALQTTLADRPTVLPVLITGEPGRYEDLLAADRILMLPRMIWAWAIHDAVRAHLAAEPWMRIGRAGSKRKPTHRRA